MLSALLKLLAVTGIILLIILGLILFVLLIILFVPITYRVNGIINQERKAVNAKIGWLFGILRFNFSYEKEIQWQLKLLWIDLTGRLKKSPQENAGIQPPIQETSTQETPMQETPIQEIPVQEVPVREAPVREAPKESTKEPDRVTEAADTPIPPKKSFSEKINDLITKIQALFAKLQDIKKKAAYYAALLQEDDTKHLISHCLKVISNILKSIRPRKLQINLLMGFEEPDVTGKVYGLLCMLYPYYGNDIHISPDFEKKILDGTLHVKGRIFICILLWNALKILLDRKLYRVIRKLKNGGKRSNGR